MKELVVAITPTLLKIHNVCALMTTKKGVALIAPVVVASAIVDVKSVIILLISLMIADFATGILASYTIWKKEHAGKLEKPRLISSQKLIKSGYKIFFYFSIIIVSYAIEKIFFINTFSFSFSIANFTVTTMATAFLCLIELFSIFVENLPKIGFDVIEMTKKIYKKFITTKSDFTAKSVVIVILISLSSCAAKKPLPPNVITTNKTIREISRDSTIVIKGEMSLKVVEIGCADGSKPTVKNISEKKDTNLKAPTIKETPNDSGGITLAINCETEAQKLFLQWKEQFISEQITEKIPVQVPFDPNWFQTLFMWAGKIVIGLAVVAVGLRLSPLKMNVFKF
jgi:phage-related holin